jgi:selenocysteine lyase/cysteine desulfurase
VRLSLLHYNAPGEIAGVIAALDEILGARRGARAAGG